MKKNWNKIFAFSLSGALCLGIGLSFLTVSQPVQSYVEEVVEVGYGCCPEYDLVLCTTSDGLDIKLSNTASLNPSAPASVGAVTNSALTCYPYFTTYSANSSQTFGMSTLDANTEINWIIVGRSSTITYSTLYNKTQDFSGSTAVSTVLSATTRDSMLEYLFGANGDPALKGTATDPAGSAIQGSISENELYGSGSGPVAVKATNGTSYTISTVEAGSSYDALGDNQLICISEKVLCQSYFDKSKKTSNYHSTASKTAGEGLAATVNSISATGSSGTVDLGLSALNIVPQTIKTYVSSGSAFSAGSLNTSLTNQYFFVLTTLKNLSDWEDPFMDSYYEQQNFDIYTRFSSTTSRFVAYNLSGSKAAYWLRAGDDDSSTSARTVTTSGSISKSTVSNQSGVRPCFVLQLQS